jgi:mono/diheme cytochrome c family protein
MKLMADRAARRTRWAAVIGGLALLSACENAMRDMYEQSKYRPLTASSLWPDGRSSRPLVPGTVAFSTGDLAGSSSGERGEIAGTVRHQADYHLASLRHGRERYTIYCAPCHGASGDGHGYITQRGFPAPPSYHSERLRGVPDAYLFGVISNGYGVMYPYADRIPPEDRWAIVAYVRALQLSQNARLADVPPAQRARLTGAPP